VANLTSKDLQQTWISASDSTVSKSAPASYLYVAMVTVVSLLVIGLAAAAILTDRQNHLERASITTQNIVTLLDKHFSDEFDKTDLVLQAVSHHYHEYMPPARPGVASIERYLEEQQSLLPEILNLRIADIDGIVKYGKGNTFSDPANLADHDFFIRAKNEPGPGLFISGPVFDRIAQQWIIVLARRLNNPDGMFAGVVYASYAAANFEKTLSALSLDKHGAATLRTTDLALVQRFPFGNSVVGSTNVSQQLRDIVKRQPEKGEYTADVAVDGITRINAYRQLEHYPFIVIVGLALEDFLDEWRTNSLALGGLAALAILVAIIAALKLFRASQLQVADQINRQRIREQDVILNSNVIGIVVVKDRLFAWCNQHFVAQLGYERDELIGQPTRMLYVNDEDHAAFVRNVLPRLAAGELCNFERQFRRKDGSIGWFQLSGQKTQLEGAETIWSVADVTDRKQGELRLQESEARFRAIFESVDAISIQGYSQDGTVTYWNPASEKIYGYSPAEALGGNLLDLIIPSPMHAEVKEAIGWMFEHKTGGVAGRLKLHDKDGNPVHVYSSHAVVEDALGHLTLFCLDIDQSEQVRTEDTLRERQSFIDAVVEIAGNVIVVLDAGGRIVRFNRAAEALSGYGFMELEGKPIWDYLIPSERRADVRAVFDMLMQEKLADSFENEWVLKDGSRRMLQWRNTTLCDAAGQITHVVALGYDVTQIRSNAQELENYRNHLELMVSIRTAEVEAARLRTQLILDSSADGIIELDAQGVVCMTNAAASSILGYQPTELIGRNVHEAIHARYPDGSDYPASECAVTHAVTTGKKLRLDNDVFWHANGYPVPVAVATHPIWQDNRVVGAVMSFFDNTERHKIEQAREEARRTAEQLARIKSEFLANMSHEIRTPLNGVLGLAQIGYRDSVGRAKAQETFARILDSGKLLLTIINDILDFSKIEAGKLSIESIPFDPACVIDDAISALEGIAANKRLRLTGEKAADLPAACLGDSVRISQVLLNLLSNAVKFTAEGEVRLSAYREGEQLVFQVIDSGIGIPPSHIERLFMPFEQADGSTTRQFGGTGLGLAISRRLAEMMGGSLTATSEVGQGSTFTLRLPLRETDQPVQRGIRTIPSSGKRLSGLRILATEDNAVNQMVLENFLKREGAVIMIVDNGQLAVDAVARGESFDVVLMDVQMPVMDGFEATRKLRQISPALPVIGQTAHALKEEHDRCLSAGMVATITKPIDIDVLVATVLEHVTAPTSRTTVPVFLIEDQSPSENKVIDWDALATRYSHHPEFVDRLVVLALKSHGNDAERLLDLINAGDLEEIGNLAHTLKGVAGNLHAPELSEICIRVMQSVKAKSDDVVAQAKLLSIALRRVIEKLRLGKPI
jgi:PAS domain S-box-containing protein